MKKFELYQEVTKELDALLLKVAQMEDPFITKLESSYRTKLINEYGWKIVEILKRK